MNIEILHSKGRLLTEDIITEITAEAIDIEYKKIDPLKLDMDTVTNYTSKTLCYETPCGLPGKKGRSGYYSCV